MKKLLFLAMLAICCATTVAKAQMGGRAKVAVYVSGEIDDVYKRIVNSKATAYISRSNKYVALERGDVFLDALMKEQDYQLSGEVRADQIVEVAARHGARYVAAFDVNITPDGFCLMTARLINVETGVIIKSIDSNRTVKGTEDLVGLTNNVAYRLFVQS